jgi:Leucine-rich repeat (LRR) protein
LPNLKSLFLGKNRITQIKGLENLKKLRQVALGV